MDAAGKRKDVTTRVLVKYVLLQLPAAAFLVALLIFLNRWVAIPSWLFWLIIAFWVTKDIVLFPLLKEAYKGKQSGPGEDLLGIQGISEEPLNPRGYVRIRGELWQAELRDPDGLLEKGEAVRVIDVHGLKVIVEPEAEV